MRVTDAVDRRPELRTERSKTSYPCELHGKTGPARHSNQRLSDETLSFIPSGAAGLARRLGSIPDPMHGQLGPRAHELRRNRQRLLDIAVTHGCTTFVSSDRWHVARRAPQVTSISSST